MAYSQDMVLFSTHDSKSILQTMFISSSTIYWTTCDAMQCACRSKYTRIIHNKIMHTRTRPRTRTHSQCVSKHMYVALILLVMFCSYSILFVRIHNRHNKQTERILYVICAHAIIPTEQCCCAVSVAIRTTYIWETQTVQSRYTELRHNWHTSIQNDSQKLSSSDSTVKIVT